MALKYLKYGGTLTNAKERRAIIKSVYECLSTGQWQAGKQAKLFEDELAQYIGTRFCCLANSGSSAGLLALCSLELPKGSEVIISACTFPTIFNIILNCGLVPVVVDAKIGTYNLDVDEVERAIGPKTKAIIAIHILGNPVDMVRLMKVAKKHDLYVIEDCCLAEGTLVKTSKGNLAIQDIKVGDEVLTRKGYRKVLRTMYKGEKEVITRLGITATPDHLFITSGGVKRFDSLNPSDILYKWNERLSSIEEKSTTDCQNLQDGKHESIIGGTVPMNRLFRFIDRFGLTTMGKSLKEWLFIIKTKILSITDWIIWNLCQEANTPVYILHSQNILESSSKISNWQERVQKNGMAHRRAELGTASMVGKSGPIERKKVWDLEIEEEHEFFANDILVHNCDSFSGAIADRRLGSFGHVSFTSFHAAHIISMGVGGGVFTSDPVLAKNVRMYRDWGRQADSTKMNTYKSLPKDYNPRFIYEKIGYNFQILDLQAAMGRVQLKKVSTFKRLRKKNFDYLYKYFKEHTMFCVPESVKGADVCWFAFPLTYAGDRGKLVAHLEKNGIETRSMMSGNILRHPAYGNVEYRIGSTLKEADYILEHSFWITCHVSLTKKDLDRIVKTFDDFFA